MSSFYCDSECSTPFVSAPSSPTKNSKSLYYYFSAPSSPPRSTISPSNSSNPPAFSLADCEFQFHSRFDDMESPRASNADDEVIRMKKSAQEQDVGDDDCVLGFYFSAPTSPDRRRARKMASIWDEMPGTPKMIFGGGGGSGAAMPAATESSPSAADFEFSSSRISNSESIVSPQMSSADELFFKGQLLPLKLRPRTNHHTWTGGYSSSSAELTTSDSSGSSQTMGSSSSASAPQSPRARISPSPAKKFLGNISPQVLPKRRFSPLHFFRKSKNAKDGDGSSKECTPSKKSSRFGGRTLRELLHLSSVHKKSKAVVLPETSIPSISSSSSSKVQVSSSRISSPVDQHGKKYMERSLVGDYSRKFHNHHQMQQQNQQRMMHRRRFHSGSILDLHYGQHPNNNIPRRFPSGSTIVPENDASLKAAAAPPALLGFEKNIPAVAATPPPPPPPPQQPRIFHGPALESNGSSAYSSKSSSGGGSKRFVNAAAAAAAVLTAAERSGGGGASSATSSRNVSPRRGRGGGAAGYGRTPEEMRRRTFLPYKQGLLGCLGCATMRIAGLSKSLQQHASSR